MVNQEWGLSYEADAGLLQMGQSEEKASVCVTSYMWGVSTAVHSSDIQGQSRCAVICERLGSQVGKSLAYDGFKPWH